MKNIFIAGVITTGTFFSTPQIIEKATANCDPGVTINANYSKAAVLDSILKKFAPQWLPGASIAVFTEAEGWWAGAQGYANVKTKTLMDNCHLQYLQSVSKSYMAVEILQLEEEGKIDLDAPMTKYLPAKYRQYIKGAENITIRMLLNHTSGIPEYNENSEFVSQVIEHPLRNFSSIDCLRYIAGDDLLFAPGSKYKYINTNYLLLSLIGDAITGDHSAFIKKNIFKPLGLDHSYYENNYSYLKGLNLPQSYWDVFNNGKPVNVTNFQQMTVVSSKGDDGIVATTTDAIKFLKGLMEGKLLKPGSMKEMFDFVKDEKGNNRYGMGMIYFDIDGIIAYGHGGGGIGAGCGLLYIPSRKMYIFFATNLGVFVESELVKKAGDFRDAIFSALLK
jgi:D-alanyl-D-alanine carboxypeptidase